MRDYTSVYSSKFGLLDEDLGNTFRVRDKTRAKIQKEDQKIVRGVESLFKSKMLSAASDNTYLIVQAGFPHLPAIMARNLLPRNIDCYFYVNDGHSRAHETIKYYAPLVKEEKEDLDHVEGIATLIDTHRDYLVSNAFPTARKLKKLGIERIICLDEEAWGWKMPLSIGRRFHSDTEGRIDRKDVGKYLRSMSNKNFTTERYGIAPWDLEVDFTYQDYPWLSKKDMKELKRKFVKVCASCNI